MKGISILGSTGSVGVTTLDVVSRFPDRFRVVAMAAGQNLEVLVDQVKRFKPELVSVATPELARDLKDRLGAEKVDIVPGMDGAIAVATHRDAQFVMSAIVGAAGLRPTLAAARAGKDVGFANKETLVVAGEVMTRAVHDSGSKLLPVDSEHNAIFQCLEGRQRTNVKRIILTASGGPFLKLPLERFATVTVAEALKHPTWRMGAKITIDSASLMNKGLEVIEARWLFDLPAEQISVVIHPQSVVHSMVEFVDGSVIAQLGTADMRIPIQLALTYPERWENSLPSMDLARIGTLEFCEPDLKKFPCLQLAHDALAAGGTMTAVLNAANEIAVESFLNQRINFVAIPRVVEATMVRHKHTPHPSLDEVIEADRWGREQATLYIEDQLSS
jgi:1-deoxy-D-xylulose-5-phosphate reductoisomerase